ncbi:hypothetical protein DPEC_G00036830 [Dallia pectoralis]|uniref:Uncharacterized protein n=1 Tax=Dallia pectoralis TaxID=75939 RepID=A0ACC2HF41_DALPE|nr:hypothetical protein DPEC_G00036830 [Dallia pectoralis]
MFYRRRTLDPVAQLLPGAKHLPTGDSAFGEDVTEERNNDGKKKKKTEMTVSEADPSNPHPLVQILHSCLVSSFICAVCTLQSRPPWLSIDFNLPELGKQLGQGPRTRSERE